MGILGKQNEILKKIEEEKQRMKQKRIKEFLEEIKKVSEKHKMVLIPIISKYGPTFEVQEIDEEPSDSSNSVNQGSN
ncbi:MAG: hypothetical protein ACTSR2_01850 [Candidatus Hodarchaeales archaeon]